MVAVDSIEIAALGKVATFGDLYDSRSDKFVSLSIFTKTLNELTIKCTDTPDTRAYYSFSNSYKEKFDELNISAEFKASILGGLITLDGSGKYFKDAKKSARSAKATLIHSIKTMHECIKVTNDDIGPYINFDVLEKVDATHVVVGIIWGGSVFMSVEDMNSDEKNTNTVEGKMKLEMEKLVKFVDVKCSGSVDINESEIEQLSKFIFELYGDILPDSVPQSLIKALEFMKDAPKELKLANNGKGKAIRYELFPISMLRSLYKKKSAVNMVLKRIDEQTIEKYVTLFDNINLVERKLNDLVKDVDKFGEYVDTSLKDAVNELKSNYDLYQIRVRQTLAKQLVLARSGEGNIIDQVLIDLIEDQSSYQNTNTKLTSFLPLKQEIAFIKHLVALDVLMLDSSVFLSTFLCQNIDNDVYILIYNFENSLYMNKLMTSYTKIVKNKDLYPPNTVFAAINLKCLNTSNYTLCNVQNNKPKISLFKHGELLVEDVEHMPLIHERLASKKLSYKPRAVLVGRTGAGKTTLLNNLCGKEHQAGAGVGSVTRNLFVSDVCHGRNAFQLIDTPGTDSQTDTYHHAYLLREALTTSALNTIFVIVKYDNRFEKLINCYWDQPVAMYGKKVVVMISHSDMSKNAENDFKEICKSFSDGPDPPLISNIILYSENSSMDMVADLMYSCMSNMEAKQIDISIVDFHLSFNIYETINNMSRSLNKYELKVKKIQREFENLVHTLLRENPADKDDVLHFLIVEFKHQIDDVLEEYQREHGATMVEIEFFRFFIQMQKRNVIICDEFVKKARSSMTYNLYDPKDPRNAIKECPNCGEVWMKTEGCDGKTTCGSRVTQFHDSDTSKKSFFKYILKRINGNLVYEKNQLEDRKELSKKETSKQGARGCGTTFVWSELPKVKDEKIFELYKVKTMEEVIKLINADNYTKCREDYERGIDACYYE